MSNVGAQLKQAREEQNKTRVDVAGKTGILIHQLAALEHGRFDDLPDDETVAGFVKVYAEYLGFLPDEPVAEFWAERKGESPAPSGEVATIEEPEAVAPRTVRAFPWGWTLAGALVVVIVVFWNVMRSDTAAPPAAVETREPPVVESTSEPSESLPASKPEPVVAAPPEDSGVPLDPDPAAPGPEPVAPAATLRVTEHGVGSGVEDRRLTGESQRFAPGSRVWFWTRVQGGRAGEEFLHVWIHEGREIGTVELDLGSSNWRTWSAKTMFDGSVGAWAVEARDASGRVLARSEFACR